MATVQTIEEFLKRQRAPYSTFVHRTAYTAQEEAAVAHVPGQDWAKTVVCFVDDEPVQAVVPAHYMVDLERLRVLAGGRTARLATEAEIGRLYPECEVGAMPPLGPLYEQRVFVEQTLTLDPEIVFNAGTHTDAIRMRYPDFADVARPIVGALGRPPATHGR